MPLTRLPLALAAVTLLACLTPACGGSEPELDPATARVARQDLSDGTTGALLSSFVYQYDASGTLTSVRTLTAGGALDSITTYTYDLGLRASATTRDPGGAVLYSTAYTYDAGVLGRADYMTSTGTSSNYALYAFVGGKKVTSTRYSTLGSLLYRNEFTYDPASGRRLGCTDYGADGVAYATSERTYVNGFFHQSRDVMGTSVEVRVFTYEAGTKAQNLDAYWEF